MTQGLGVAYALLPLGYRTTGAKERLVRIAGACWPFCWLCDLVWQFCFTQERFVAALLALQGVFAGSAVALSKLLPLLRKCSPLQRWAYYTSSCALGAWTTVQSCWFALMLVQKARSACTYRTFESN